MSTALSQMRSRGHFLKPNLSLIVAPLPRSSVRFSSSSSNKEAGTPAPANTPSKTVATSQAKEKGADEQVLKGDEPIYPIYTDPNPLFDTYVKAEHRRPTRKPKNGPEQEYNVETTLFNDPPLFMIEPRLRPTPRFPTRKYIQQRYRANAEPGMSLLSGENEEAAMKRMDREDASRRGSAAAKWGADDLDVEATMDGAHRETTLDTALDHQAWNVSDLRNDFEQWDRHATPRGDTSSLPAPAEAQTLPPSVVSTLMRFPLVTKRVVQQGGKGRMASWYVLTVAGNGEGLVGVGEGKDTENARAIEKSFIAACKDLDWVDRFEGRTIWSNIETKWGSTRLYLRPRPMGFGLRCNPYIHQVRSLSFLFHGSLHIKHNLSHVGLQGSRYQRYLSQGLGVSKWHEYRESLLESLERWACTTNDGRRCWSQGNSNGQGLWYARQR